MGVLPVSNSAVLGPAVRSLLFRLAARRAEPAPAGPGRRWTQPAGSPPMPGRPTYQFAFCFCFRSWTSGLKSVWSAAGCDGVVAATGFSRTVRHGPVILKVVFIFLALLVLSLVSPVVFVASVAAGVAEFAWLIVAGGRRG